MTRYVWFISICGTVVMAMVSCKREERSFHMPAADAEAPTTVPVNNPVRPGPEGQPLAANTRTGDLLHMLNEPFGSQFANNALALSDGQTLYEFYNCVGCHAHGGGGMGPPLMDDKWYYGASPDQVFSSIVEGRKNGMPSFRGRIPDYQVWEIAAYVRSLSGQANPNASSGREDHMRAAPPPNSMSKESPQTIPAPATGPATNQVTGLTTKPAK